MIQMGTCSAGNCPWSNSGEMAAKRDRQRLAEHFHIFNKQAEELRLP